MMSWPAAAVRRLFSEGLDRGPPRFRRRPDGSWFFSGPDRGPGWHRHGTTASSLWDLRDGVLVGERIHKQRWLEVATKRTEHDRPPDQLGRGRYSAVIVVIMLAGWLLGGRGVHGHEPLLESLRERPSARTLQRWSARAADRAADLEQAVRRTWLELKPRQAGDDVPGGIPPPLHPGPWRGRTLVYRLPSVLSMVLGCSIALNQPGASLLAEAKRRHPDRPFITA